jgi:alpha-N-arabinofuranosidase
VVNRSTDEALRTSIELDGYTIGAVTVHEVTGPDPYTRNSFDAPNAVDVRTRHLADGGPMLQYTFPAHSVTVLRGHSQHRQ